MRGLAGTMMVMLAGGSDRHRHTTGSQHDQSHVHDDGQTGDRTDEMSRAMSGHITFSHSLFIRRSL